MYRSFAKGVIVESDFHKVPMPIPAPWSPAYESGNRDTVGGGSHAGRAGIYGEIKIPDDEDVPTQPSDFAYRVHAQ